MIKMMTLTALTLIWLTGCGQSGSSDTENKDKIYDKVSEYNNTVTTPPYDYQKFRTVLNRSRLQYPDITVVVPSGHFDGYQAPWFYSLNGDLFFSAEKPANLPTIRSELREESIWKTSDTTRHIWSAKLKCFKPQKGINAYTWMQILGTNDSFNYPLIRLMWVRNYHGIYDHLWAIVITSDAYDPNITYDWVDLGERTGDYVSAKVEIADNTMRIFLNDTVIRQYDVTYWQSVDNYFKAGIYINRPKDHGKATVAFHELSFTQDIQGDK
ncbi:MAG: hypothetical protein DSZ05_00550 [Sulfurospirillum sp.]|nr:MAG: hypothetical protein DSZ05_00550 [Sulfurospirillum sp.]